ncbi:MAG: hypothetical protein LBK03_02730 [Bacteroidales bacterium]|jgi:hypothetical protein|nr:hypothetical protein [Bacteroidales bacterium]
MKNLIRTTLIIINLLFSLRLSAQEAVTKSSKIGKPYSSIIHSVAFEFNNALYFKGKMTEHPRPDLGYETRMTYGTEWILKYNLTFKSGIGLSLEAVKGTCSYEFMSRIDGDKHLISWGRTPLDYLSDILTEDRLGFNIKASYRYDINRWLTILPEIGVQMLYYKPKDVSIVTTSMYENPDGTLSDGGMLQFLLYNNDLNKRKFFPDLSASFNFLFHKKNDPRHNFTVGLNMNICFIDRYYGGYSIPPFEKWDCKFILKSSYLGLRFGYSYSSFPKPVNKTKKYRQQEPYTSFDLHKSVHSIGISFSGGFPLYCKFKNTTGSLSFQKPHVFNEFVPELNLKYSCFIKKGWGITVEVPFGVFRRTVKRIFDFQNLPIDTVWSNGVVGWGDYGNGIGIKTYYLGFALKATNLVNVHRNVMLQSEAGLKWLPFITPAKWWDIDESVGEFVISDGTETEKLVYMNCMPSISAASYAVPDLAFSFNVLVHGKNPAHNFVFGINGNISFMDRFHFKYQTTDVLPARLQSSGEFGWRMSSIGFHIGYQWMSGKKKL